MAITETINATEFKAKCLEILDRVSRNEVQQVTVTKRGKVVAVVTPPPTDVARVRQLHGFMRGSVVIPRGFDLTAPVVDEKFDAALGKLHR